jgi:hypothetical protein
MGFASIHRVTPLKRVYQRDGLYAVENNNKNFQIFSASLDLCLLLCQDKSIKKI